ncbi:protein NODULATION SIGNALING PATHWAY 2-like [Rhodamnia argentea]|uniref:Protein NODULATION SIGNALING PATHWAY 2-like n=1 Tax=Rhodamnia argentea TaxID=178133 RepID=A0A8B8PRB5_9MYRT|nr:protein NODULATION SIGNALING PATHWAY 2-like [Rhodamnia argentea]
MDNPVGHGMGSSPNSEFYIGGHEFCSTFTNTEVSSQPLSSSYLPSEFSPALGEMHNSKNSELDPIEAILMEIDGLEPFSSCNDKGWTASPISSLYSEITNDVSSAQASLTLPFEGMEVDNKLGLPHLLKAYGEAMENEQCELLDVLSVCISERANPLGNTMDRLAFYMFDRTQDLDYIKQEAFKNFKPALNAVYQISPHGRFAYFAANLAIIESVPEHIEAVHVIDFDMGEAFQWSALIESMAMAGRRVALRLTSIKWDDEKCLIEFEEVKRRLQEQAKALGVELVTEEMRIDALVSEMKRLCKRGGDNNDMSSEWMVFNVMKGLPHMGRRRSESLVGEFLRLAKEVIAHPAVGGIITSGQGETSHESRNCSGFGDFFEENIKYYHAILESIESDLKSQQLVEARLAVESLFVSPFVSCLGWFQSWGEARERLDVPLGSCCVDGWRISQANLMEAMELISGKRSYSVAIGENENEMVLEWKDSHMPLVRFSAWGNLSMFKANCIGL